MMNIVKATKLKTFTPDREVKQLMQEVHEHPVFSALDDKHALSVFMSHHVFAVWDFMSLVKSVQSFVAPYDTMASEFREFSSKGNQRNSFI